MKLVKETFLNLQSVEKITRTPVIGYSGLYCEQNKTGFTFQMKYKSPVNGNRRFMKLARFKYGDNINKKMLDNVLKQLVINQGTVAQGIDPIEKKRAETEDHKPKKQSKTVVQVYDEYTETNHYKALAKNTQTSYENQYRIHTHKFWGNRIVDSISRSEVKRYVDKIDNDTVANAVIKSLQRVQRQAIDLNLIDAPFLFNINPRAAGTRTKLLPDEEIVELMTSSTGLDGLRNIAKMQLLTGCRAGEVCGLRWDEIDMISKTWTIPHERIKTERAYRKMVRPHIIPLMPKMAEILLQQRQHGTKGLVFKKTFRNFDTPYDPTSVKYWLKKYAGIEGGTHQLRRTCASKLSEIPGVTEFDLKLVLNHVASGTTQVYIISQQIERKREIYNKWHQYINLLIEMEKKEAV